MFWTFDMTLLLVSSRQWIQSTVNVTQNPSIAYTANLNTTQPSTNSKHSRILFLELPALKYSSVTLSIASPSIKRHKTNRQKTNLRHQLVHRIPPQRVSYQWIYSSNRNKRTISRTIPTCNRTYHWNWPA